MNLLVLFFFNALPCEYSMPGSCPALCLNPWMTSERISALPGWITHLPYLFPYIALLEHSLVPQFKATVNIPDTSCPERYVPLLSLLPRTTYNVFYSIRCWYLSSTVRKKSHLLFEVFE